MFDIREMFFRKRDPSFAGCTDIDKGSIWVLIFGSHWGHLEKNPPDD